MGFFEIEKEEEGKGTRRSDCASARNIKRTKIAILIFFFVF